MWHTGPILRALWRNKVGALLVIVQMALTMAIVSNALTIIDDHQAQIDQPTGMADNELFSVNAYPTVKQPLDPGKVQQDLDGIRALPGVIDAALISQVPVSGSGSSSGFRPAASERGRDHVGANIYNASTSVVHTLGLKLVKGRDFTPADFHQTTTTDTHDAAVAIISQQMADQLFPGKDPIGQSITRDNGLIEVVGVVQTMLGAWPSWSNAGNVVITPDFIADAPMPRYIIRVKPGQRSEVMKKVPELLRSIDPNRVIMGVRTMNEWKQRVYASDIFMVGAMKACITILALITALGISGLTVFWVNQRRKQVGTRRALGATRADVVRYFLVENGMLSLLSTVLGTGLALALNHLLVQHYQLPAMPVGYLLVSVGALLVLGQLSALMPAIKAAQISPATATRSV